FFRWLIGSLVHWDRNYYQKDIQKKCEVLHSSEKFTLKQPQGAHKIESVAGPQLQAASSPRAGKIAPTPVSEPEPEWQSGSGSDSGDAIPLKVEISETSAAAILPDNAEVLAGNDEAITYLDGFIDSTEKPKPKVGPSFFNTYTFSSDDSGIYLYFVDNEGIALRREIKIDDEGNIEFIAFQDGEKSKKYAPADLATMIQEQCPGAKERPLGQIWSIYSTWQTAITQFANGTRHVPGDHPLITYLDDAIKQGAKAYNGLKNTYTFSTGTDGAYLYSVDAKGTIFRNPLDLGTKDTITLIDVDPQGKDQSQLYSSLKKMIQKEVSGAKNNPMSAAWKKSHKQLGKK
ncbi:MAG TPA: hypothetical protein VN457_02145, partial [Chlamydiales bacterium]|nr:hypothetical protein [Chlamydiales bacterium]